MCSIFPYRQWVLRWVLSQLFVLGYVDVRENDSKKTKHIKKVEKDKDAKGSKKGKKKDNNKESSEAQKEGNL